MDVIVFYGMRQGRCCCQTAYMVWSFASCILLHVYPETSLVCMYEVGKIFCGLVLFCPIVPEILYLKSCYSSSPKITPSGSFDSIAFKTLWGMKELQFFF
jgi:hypothetical protein